MAWRYQFKGGTHKPTEQATYKFYMFAILDADPPEEVIYYQAKKRDIFYSASDADCDRERLSDDSVRGGLDFMTRTPEVKLFMACQGFGIRKSYYSFFFRFDRRSDKIITIRPFGFDNHDYIFSGRGRFWTVDEIKARFGEDSQTYAYYKRQTYLSKAELLKHVTITSARNPMSSSCGVRMVRI